MMLSKIMWRIKLAIIQCLERISPRLGLRKKIRFFDTLIESMTKDVAEPSRVFSEDIRHDVDGLSIYLFRKDKIITPYVLQNRYWEPEITFAMRTILGDGDVFIDVGANIGYHTVIAANMVGKTGKVICAEPDPEIYGLLEKNIKANRFEERVVRLNAAISDRNADLDYYINDDNRSDGRMFVSNKSTRAPIKVKTVSLSKFLFNNHPDLIPKIKCIKIDVQGYEPIILADIIDVLRKNSIYLIVELAPVMLREGGYSWQEMVGALRGLGYSLNVIEKECGTKKMKTHEFTDQEGADLEERACEVDLFCFKKSPQ